MIEKELTIVNKLGLHARAAAKLVSLASGFDSDIEIARDGRRVNGKSIMGVMMLAASQGAKVTFYVDGTDADEAMQKMESLVADKFGEGE
ncbi:MAG: HPr family phosphocarrier protein [Gammaproteobacteria bacterium]|nr:HPr family phosphocarrier protein [Gammaproteobacteria bacterium]